MFESRRKTLVDVEPRITIPADDPVLRNEQDPDPLIEEMVQRLRDGLSSLSAYDEWGRPLAWRNVVRLAVGPLSGRLRDAETAVTVAAHLAEPEQQPAEPVVLSEAVQDAVQEAVHEAVHEALNAEPEPGAVRYGVAAAVSRTVEDVVLDEAVLEPSGSEAVEVVVEAMETLSELASEPEPEPEPQAEAEAEPEPEPDMAPVASQTELWVAPEAEVGEQVAAEEPAEVTGHMQPPTRPATAVPLPATSIFRVSGDQRSVAMGPLGAGELEGRRGSHDPTVAKYDRFLTSLYRQGEQVRGDEDRRSR